MQGSLKIYETRLHRIWLSQDFKSNLKTVAGEEIHVLDSGVLNEDQAGPDFKNARIRIGSLVYVGDIEIDCDYNNWKTHGHNIDNKHNKVILHVCLINKNNHYYVYTKDGRRVPTMSLSKFIDRDDLKEMESYLEVNEDNSQIRCAHLTGDVDHLIKKNFISKLGIERFKKKCDRVYFRLTELLFLKELHLKEPSIRYDLRPELENKKFTSEEFNDIEIWRQLLYELVFEALGYSKNKSIMLKLAQSVNLEFLKKLGSDIDSLPRYESAFFNIGGLMPDKSEFIGKIVPPHINQLNKDWELIKRIYDGELFNNSEWHFFRSRPQNFPTIRIAGGVRFLEQLLFNDLLGIITKKFKEIRNLSVLIKSLRTLFVIKSKGFWNSHYTFEQPATEEIKYFIGASRADEIIINVILPYFAVYFELFGEVELAKKVLKIYNVYDQRSDNKIIKEVAAGLNSPGFLRKTILAQGLLELFRSYCSKRRCLECEIGIHIFN